MITYPPGSKWGENVRGVDNFPGCLSEQAFTGWAPASGKLQKVLRNGEFNLLGEAPVFESSFVQVTKKGEFVNIHNHPNLITIGILASSPSLLLPDLMIIARPKAQQPKDLEITRLIPLDLVDVFVQDQNVRLLKVQMVTGRKYYLQLTDAGGDENLLFERWMRLIYLMHVVSGKISTPMNVTPRDSAVFHTIWKSASMNSDTKKHWISSIMAKDSDEYVTDQASPFGEKQKSIQSDIASKQNTVKSGYAGYSSQGTLGLSVSEDISRKKSPGSRPSSPSQGMSTTANKQSVDRQGAQTGPSSSHKSSGSQKKSKSKQASASSSARTRTSVGVGSSNLDTVSVGVGPSTILETAGSSKLGSSRRGTRMSWESEDVPIKLQRSQKSRSLVQSRATILSSESSQSHREKKPAPKSHASVAVGPSDVHDISVAIGSSEVGAKSVAAGPSKPASQASHVVSAKSGVSERPAVTISGSQAGSKTSRATSAKSRASSARAKPSEAGREAAAKAEDRPVSREKPVQAKSSEKYRTSATPPEQEGQRQSKAQHSQTKSMKSQETSKALRHRPQASSNPSPDQKHSGSWSPQSEVGSQLHRATVSVAVGPSQTGWKTVAVGPSETFSQALSRPQSRALETDKQRESKTKSSGVKSSGAPEKQESSRVQVSGSKSKLKAALSTARRRSSLTFITIYSALSSSVDKLKSSKSKEEVKLPAEDETSPLDSKASKRVTISGVIGPSGKNILQPEMENLPEPSIPGTPRMDAGSRTEAMPGKDAEGRLLPQALKSAIAGTSEPKVTTLSVRFSTGEDILGATEHSTPDSQVSAKESALIREDSTRMEVTSLPPRHETGVGRSVVDTASVAAGPSIPGDWSRAQEQGEPITKSQKQSKTGYSQKPSSRLSLVPKTPDRSHTSVGVGTSKAETRSVAVGHSARDVVSEAAGPSVQSSKISTQAPKESMMRSQQQSTMDDDRRPSSQPSSISREPDKSRISVGAGTSVAETKSMAVGHSKQDMVSEAAGPSMPPSKITQAPKESRMRSRQQSTMDDYQRPSSQPSVISREPDKSHISVGAGTSVVETKSVAVGSLGQDTVSKAAGPSVPESEHRFLSYKSSTQAPEESNMRFQRRSRTAELEEALAAKLQQQSRASLKEWTSSGPEGHVSENIRRAAKLPTSVGAGHSTIETKSVAVGRSLMDTVSKAAGPSKPSSKTESRLPENSVFKPGGWVEYVETGKKPVDKRTPSQKPRTSASPSRHSNRASKVMSRPSSGSGRHAIEDTSARSELHKKAM